MKTLGRINHVECRKSGCEVTIATRDKVAYCEKHKGSQKSLLDIMATILLTMLLIFFAGMAFGVGSIYGSYLLETWIPCN